MVPGIYPACARASWVGGGGGGGGQIPLFIFKFNMGGDLCDRGSGVLQQVGWTNFQRAGSVSQE